MMVTAYGDDQRRRRAGELGACEFLTKPVDFDLLKARLASCRAPHRDVAALPSVLLADFGAGANGRKPPTSPVITVCVDLGFRARVTPASARPAPSRTPGNPKERLSAFQSRRDLCGVQC